MKRLSYIDRKVEKFKKEWPKEKHETFTLHDKDGNDIVITYDEYLEQFRKSEKENLVTFIFLGIIWAIILIATIFNIVNINM